MLPIRSWVKLLKKKKKKSRHSGFIRLKCMLKHIKEMDVLGAYCTRKPRRNVAQKFYSNIYTR